MNTHKLLVTILALICVLLSACLPPSGGTPGQSADLPQGIWEGAQEAGEVDWSMSLQFEGSCTEGVACAKVYYVPCQGDFTFNKEEKGELVFTETITDHPDQCFSGATVGVKYKGQGEPMELTWYGPDGSAGPTGELTYQDPNASPAPIEGLGQEIAMLRMPSGGYINFGFSAQDDTLWIPDNPHGTVLRYDVPSNEPVAEIKVGDPARATYGDPQTVAVSGDTIWVTQCAEKKLARIDPATNQIVDSIQLEVEPYDIAIDGETLWVTAFEASQLLRVNAETKEIATINEIENPLGVAVGGGAVWVAEHRAGNLVRIDPQGNRIDERIKLPDGSTPENVIFAEGAVWVANNLGHSISRVDPQTNEQTAIPFDDRVTRVSDGGGLIWASLWPEELAEVDLSKYSLAQIDPATNEVVQRFSFPGAAASAYLDGVLWIVDRNDASGDKIHGIQLDK